MRTSATLGGQLQLRMVIMLTSRCRVFDRNKVDSRVSRVLVRRQRDEGSRHVGHQVQQSAGGPKRCLGINSDRKARSSWFKAPWG